MVHPTRAVVFGRKGLSPIAAEAPVPMQPRAETPPAIELCAAVPAAAGNEPATDKKPAASRKGVLATLLMPLILVFKLFKLGKFGGTAISMVLSLVIYSWRFGWLYAAGFIALLFLHEMGHYLAAQRRGLKVGMPTFIPFVGAWIELKEQPMDAETEAYVALAGPLVGSVAATACYVFAREVGSQLLLAIAYAGFFLNFFNLIPISPLDGGRIAGVLSPRIWFLGVPVMLAMLFFRPSPLLVLIAIMAVPSLKRAWRYDPKAPENRAYYGIPTAKRAEYAALYIVLTAYLALMTSVAHGALGGTPSTSAQAQVQAPVGKDGPPTGHMQSWAKLYPDAVVVRNRTQVMFGLTDWRVTFTTHASPEQIGAFYEGLARSEGFTITDGLFGLHRFTQPGTNNMFSYMTFQFGGEPQVVFEARSGAKL